MTLSSKSNAPKKEEGTMRLSEIEKRARDKGIKDTWKYSKKELIHQIQKTEGSNSCFATGNRACGQMACCWRVECIR